MDLKGARALEKAGHAEAAIQAYRELGAIEDAARLLGATKRPREAGQLLLESLRVQPAQVGQLDAAGKKRALMSAIFFGKAGENELAVELFVALGEKQRAVELLQRAGDSVGAARVMAGGFTSAPMLARPQAMGGGATSVLSAQKLEQQGKLDLALQAYLSLRRYADGARLALQLGDRAHAAELYAEAGMPFEAAERYLEVGDTGKALDNLARVARDDARYRTAAARAVRLATNLGTIEFRLEHFLGPFVKAGPQDAEEVKVFELLAQLYQAHHFPENAREVVDKILLRDKANAFARQKLGELDAELRPSAAVARAVLSDAELHKKMPSAKLDFSSLPGLEEEGGVATILAVKQAAEDEVIADAEVIVEEPEPAREKFAIGSVIAGRYRLEKQIGQGGMATVFKAFDLELEEDVALKVFGAQLTNETLVQRFKQELKLSRQLTHPNIIRLHDIGVHEGHRYISMELLNGKTLKGRMKEKLSLDTGLDYLVQASNGLQAAHDMGVVHRDVKPDNFFVTAQGVVKVMDFGIAKQQAAPGVTVAGSIAGTPLYMSPEQISNFSTVTHLTDVYALGVCAYEMFCGTVPFNHDDLIPLLMMHVNEAPVPPRQRNPKVPAELDAAICRMLEKDPAKRPQSCREVARELEEIRRKYKG